MSRRIGKERQIVCSIVLLFFIFVVSVSKAPWQCYSKPETQIECSQYWQEASSGEIVSFELSLNNPSYNYDSFLVYIDDPQLPENWSTSFYFDNRRVRGISILPRRSVSLVLQVVIPGGASPGDYRLKVVADGEYSIATRTLMVTVMSVQPVTYGIELYSPVDWQVTYPGNNLTFSLRVKNLAPEIDDYLVYVDRSLPKNWMANFYSEGKKVKAFSALPEETVNLVVEIDVPEGATPDDYRFRVQIDGKYASATKGLTITVEIPPPIPREISLLSPFQSQSILTGQTTYYPIKITNEGQQAEKVFLVVNATSEMMTWDFSFSEDQLTLAPQESVWIRLDVIPPAIVEEGDYTVNITALTEDGELEPSLQTTTKILGDYHLEVTGVEPINPETSSGEKIDVIVAVRNLGQSPLTNIRLSVKSDAISNILVSPLDILAVEPMASVNFYLRITPNTNLTPGDYIVEVQAESSETRSTGRSFAVSVVSPIPWFWISICITVIATALAVISIQRLISRWDIRIRVRK